MEIMNEMQKIAFDNWIGSAGFETDFKPMSEKKLCELMNEKGYEVGATSIHRWRVKFGWDEMLKTVIATSLSEDTEVKSLITKSALQTSVKNTKVDVARNEYLMSACYEVLELEALDILAKKKETGKISSDEFDRAHKIAKLVVDRQDKMLDRLANMPRDIISSAEVLESLAKVALEVEDAEILKESLGEDDEIVI
ncbi:hypothetical protein CFT12S00416_05610 [Campylobacter fetus subsp. testudinum]|uniref:hypothetical protein n=1 Tax=Campylobacter fetus TaxID=196 RepID=UPI0008189BFD|nr:hypothetical protein [Campylobacter fetus]OCR88900.1 hypothetical protein CFT12S00416_05610 [Campylobacter fetus subsp. testudinum]